MNKMTYKCNLCEYDFKQKIDLDRHLKKNKCIPINKIIDIKEQQNINNGKISELHSLFKTCLDILRNDAEHLIGDEALNELSHFIILKQLEKHIINNSIDIYNFELYYDGIKKYGKEIFIEQLEYIKFSKLVEYIKIPDKENNIKHIFDNFLWKEILSKHPKFKDVFEDGKKSFIKESSTIKKLIITLSNIDFDNYEYDILGEAYERIFVDAIYGAGKGSKSQLGQFFTSPKVKDLLVNLVNPKVKENGEIESVLDPSAGTGGILNTVIKHFKKNNQITTEDLRKQLINNIYGIEIKGKIYNLCLSNMLINTGHILPNVICADSIRKFHNIKVDTIIANPPFSVNINYNELLSSLGSIKILDDYIPIKAGGKNSEVLFLQMMIHCLKINGRCATVMLDGQKIYGDSSGYDKIREYLMKSCELHEVILCPAGTFTSTASKTCILFFTKKKERKDVLEIKGSKRELIFDKVHSTIKVQFYDFNPDTEEKIFIKEVDIKDIASKKYSLNYTEYNVEDKCKDEENIKWVELNEVCKIKFGDRIVKKNTTSGEYDVYGGGDKTFSTDTFNREGYNILIARFALSKICVRLLNKKFYLNDSGLTISINKEYGNNNYIGYYLVFNQYLIYNLARGTGQKNLDMENFKKIKIPMVSIEKQNNIVEFLDKLYETNQIKIQDTINYYENNNIFKLLLDEKYNIFNYLIIAQIFKIKINNINNILNIKDELENLLKFKNIIINKLKDDNINKDII
uniref:site-specific DNA-methyltransferase (adenine-specific) n=1 Tax=viral metagenome TaxID=1070528 RepID=A0A6C0H929_9ZZZZ